MPSIHELEAQLRNLVVEQEARGVPESQQRHFRELLAAMELESGSRPDRLSQFLILGDDAGSKRRYLELLLKEKMIKDRKVFEVHPYIRVLFLDAESEAGILASYTPRRYSVAVQDYLFTASVGNEPELDVETVLVRPTDEVGKTRRHPLMPHFSTLIGFAVDYFRGLGTELTGIRGSWIPKYQGLGTNWVVYQEALAQGRTRGEAALLTPTGKVASRLGFRFPYMVPDHPTVIAKGVDVVFYKTPRGA